MPAAFQHFHVIVLLARRLNGLLRLRQLTFYRHAQLPLPVRLSPTCCQDQQWTAAVKCTSQVA